MQKLIGSYTDPDRHTPFGIPRVPGLECCSQCSRCGLPGGDFLNAIAPGDEQLLATLGSVPTALSGRVLIAALQAAFRALGSCNVELPVIVAELNRVLWEDAPDDTVGCLFTARVTPRLRRIEYVAAGDQLVLLFRSTGCMERLECNAPPLGLARRNSFRQQVSDFAPGDTLIAVTEGAEAGLESLIREIAHDRIRDIPSRVLDASPTTADRTVLVIHGSDADRRFALAA